MILIGQFATGCQLEPALDFFIFYFFLKDVSLSLLENSPNLA